MSKPIPAVVETVTAQVEAAVIAASKALNEAEVQLVKLERRAEDARGTVAMRRRELGLALIEARKAWPARGPNSKGWGEFLARIGIAQSTAWRLMDQAGYKEAETLGTPDLPGISCSGGQQHENADDHAGVEGQLVESPVERTIEAVNGNGGSGDPMRGAYCTPKKYADAVGEWDLDPFSNPRSHIRSELACLLERGDNGLMVPSTPGSYWIAPLDRESMEQGATAEMFVATPETRVFLQPPYSIVEEAIAHYGHTRFCALLRFDPSTEWFARLWALTTAIAIPVGERIEFEPPPGVEASANPYPHAFYYSDESDITDEIRQLCIVLRVEH